MFLSPLFRTQGARSGCWSHHDPLPGERWMARRAFLEVAETFMHGVGLQIVDTCGYPKMECRMRKIYENMGKWWYGMDEHFRGSPFLDKHISHGRWERTQLEKPQVAVLGRLTMWSTCKDHLGIDAQTAAGGDNIWLSHKKLSRRFEEFAWTPWVMGPTNSLAYRVQIWSRSFCDTFPVNPCLASSVWWVDLGVSHWGCIPLGKWVIPCYTPSFVWNIPTYICDQLYGFIWFIYIMVYIK